MAMILIDKNVMVPMRDGVRLANDVYRLDGAPPAPVLLTRTPYDKEHAVEGSNTFDILRAVQTGYAVVIQDVRGRSASEGEFDPMIHETRDGVDTFAWAAAQPWSSGVVGTFGGSYVGCTQWLPAREHPPALQAMAPAVTFSDMYEGNTYQGGAKVLHDLRWVVADIIPGEIRRRVMRGGKPPEGAASLDVNDVLADLPVASHPLIRDLAPFYLDWLAHSTPDAYWSQMSPRAGYLWATANVFLPGHRIRLEVASSNFPRFDRNSNTGGEIASEAAGQYRPAINRIFHDATHPSRLILPIVER